MANSRTTSFPLCSRPGPYSVKDQESTQIPGETLPHRHPSAREGLVVEPEQGVATCYDILRRGARLFGEAPALGSRKLIKIHSEDKETPDGQGGKKIKKWSLPELSDYAYISYAQLEQNAVAIGSLLRRLAIDKDDRIAIYAASSGFWLTCAQGACSQSITIVTAYETLGEEGLSHSLRQTGAKAVFVDPDQLHRVSNVLDNNPTIIAVIYNDHNTLSLEDSAASDFRGKHPKVQLLSYMEALQDSSSTSHNPVPPTSHDLACIMYTSGSTGPPKGVLLKHRQVVAAVAAVGPLLSNYVRPGDRVLAYLPLAHIIEFVVETAGLFWGATLGYGNPRTLTNTNVKNCEGDLQAFKPSLMVGVPAIWETVKKGILARVNKTNVVARSLFWAAIWAKQRLLSYHIIAPVRILDDLVFHKIKAATGGQLKLVLNGGGAVSGNTMQFISYAICPMIGGYGLTETCGMGALVEPDAWTPEGNGGVPSSVEVKLVDVPDLEYLTSNVPPQGEIWIRGPAVTEGYFQAPDEDAKAFQNGWFKTGDIGEFNDLGQLKIIDRKKNLVKTLNGEYIALEKLETQYRSSSSVANICVHATAEQAKPIAIVVCSESAVREIAGAATGPLHELCADASVRRTVLQNLNAVGKRAGLHDVELLQNIVLTAEPWTPENGLLTNAQKLNRKAIVKQFDGEITAAYGSS